MSPLPVRLAARLYRWLLRLLPEALRLGHGDEMLALQERLAREAWESRGMAGVASVLAAASADVLRERGAQRAEDAWRRPTRRPVAAFFHDVRLARRHLLRNPGFSVLAILTLGLGIGAATAIFGVVDAVVLQPLPYESPDELVRVRERTPRGDSFSLSEPNFLDLRAGQQSFANLAGVSWGNRVWRSPGETRSLPGLAVTHDYFRVLGVTPLLGRVFDSSEDRPGAAARVVLISRGFWERAFGSDPSVVGRRIELDEAPHTVVGVVPVADGPFAADVFTPLAPDAGARRDNHMVDALGRLADGVSLDQARADLGALAKRLGALYPDTNGGWGVEVTALRDTWIGDRLTRLGWTVLAAALLLLVMACTSVSNLLLARASVRRRELALRAALGAPRLRLVRQLLLEGAWLAAAGAVLGVGLSALAMPAIRALGPSDLPRLAAASLDGRALAFTVAAAVASVAAAALLPALFATAGGTTGGLREVAATASPARRRLRSALVVAQVAVAVTLLLCGALLTRSFERLRSVDLGFETERSLRFRLRLPEGRYDPAARVRFVGELEERIAELGSVAAVGTMMGEPFGDFRAANFVAAADAMPERAEEFLPVSWRAVTPGFFGALRVRLLAGRLFDNREPTGPDSIEVVVDEKAARTLWPDRSAVGEVLVWGDPAGARMRVVGVVSTLRDETLEEVRPRVYLAYALFPWPEPALLVRSRAGTTADVGATVRAAIAELDPGLAADPPVPLASVLSDVVAWPRFSMQIVGAFGLAALAFASLGLAGVVAFLVRTRTRELGVRLALGASPAGVVWMVVRSGLGVTALGLGLGTAAALGAGRALGSLLYGVEPHDPVSLLATAAVVGFVSLLATALPALAAASIDPRRALASE